MKTAYTLPAPYRSYRPSEPSPAHIVHNSLHSSRENYNFSTHINKQLIFSVFSPLFSYPLLSTVKSTRGWVFEDGHTDRILKKSPQKTSAANSWFHRKHQFEKSAPLLSVSVSPFYILACSAVQLWVVQLKGVSGFPKLLKGMIDFQAAVQVCLPKPWTSKHQECADLSLVSAK